MKFISLFAGIGGFDLGLERAGMECVAQIEIDEFCLKVLTKHWPDVPKWKDIKDVKGKDLPTAELVCGGFPCQDVSVAGKKEGLSGARSGLWWEYHRLVREIRPKYIIVESVPGLLKRGMDEVTGSLVEIGYDCEWHCIPVGAIGGHFLGDRVYIIAQNPPARSLRLQRGWPATLGANQWGGDEFERLVQLEIQHGVPAGKLGRICDGISNRMDRLKALGNAVVPQIVGVIGREILMVENDE